MKVLIGVDGSPLSLDAVRLVAKLIDPARDEVAIYFSPMELKRRLTNQSATVVRGAAAALFAEARVLLPTEFAKPPEMITSSASAAVGILESASGWHADLVAVGARGHGSIEQFLLGSVPLWPAVTVMETSDESVCCDDSAQWHSLPDRVWRW